ncbi:MAG TPA: hypothetical protein VE422_22545 [Terriglobia bacterium]|nr:hypothetical protein [Terriglobia bacterium]
MATHQTRLEIGEPIPAELEAGAIITMRIKVSCAEGCDLRGVPVKVAAVDEVVIASELAAYEKGTNETEDLTVKAPGQVGEHAWTFLFPRHELDGVIHEESSLVVSLTTRPHTTSMAVWGAPSPVVVKGSFSVKVGVRCATECGLAGQLIEVCDESGTRIGEGRLGETPWPGSTALYVAHVDLIAPAGETMVSWSARFAAAESKLPHAEASAAFGLRTVRPPEHWVTVKVAQKDTDAPLENVELRLGVYRASTDAQGIASLELPGGTYDLDAWKAGYEIFPRTVEVAKDLMLQVEALLSPEKNSDDTQVWM